MGEALTVDAVSDPARFRPTMEAAAAGGATAVDETTGALVVLRHAEIEDLAHDPRLVGVGLTWFDLMGITGPMRDWYGSLMFTNEGEAHSRLRRLVARAFTPRAVEELRSSTRELVEAHLASLDRAGEGDLIEIFSRLSVRVMCRLLGVPEADVDGWGHWADALSPVFGYMDPDQIRAAETALAELLVYVAELVDKRHHAPGDDLVTRLVRAEEQGQHLERDEVVMLVTNLLVAAHDTTTSQIGCSLLTLLLHPEATMRLRGEPDLVAPTVSETMRFEPSIGIIPRTVVEPVNIGGVERAVGTMVLLAVVTGNRDPTVWSNPDRFDIERFTRPDAPRLLSFGTGTHFCLGAHLARLTLEESVAGFLRRNLIPHTDLASIEWRVVLGRSPAALPVSLEPSK